MILEQHTLEPWLVVDIILLGVLILLGLGIIKIKRAKRRLLEFQRELSEKVRFSQKLERLLEIDNPRSAIIKFFNQLIEDLSFITGYYPPRSLTVREAIKSIAEKLPDSANNVLERIYDLYEEVRFGGGNPTNLQLSELITLARELEKHVRHVVGAMKNEL